MTLAELHERIGWQLEGRLDYLQAGGCWAEWVLDVPPTIHAEAAEFRRRPDAPPMPDEVWVPQQHGPGVQMVFTAYTNRLLAKKKGEAIRYIRADGIIDGKRMQWRPTLPDGSHGEWRNINESEYRFKP